MTVRCKLKISDISSIIARCDEELTKLRKPARNADIPAGLENSGNWCFINVILQCLFSLWPFRSLLYWFCLVYIYSMQRNCSDHSSLVYSLQKLFASMALSPKSVVSPSEFISTLPVDSSSPQSAISFFSTLLSLLSNACDGRDSSVPFSFCYYLAIHFFLFHWCSVSYRVLSPLSSCVFRLWTIHISRMFILRELFCLGMRFKTLQTTWGCVTTSFFHNEAFSFAILFLSFVSISLVIITRCKRNSSAESLVRISQLPLLLSAHLHDSTLTSQDSSSVGIPNKLNFSQFSSLVGNRMCCHVG